MCIARAFRVSRPACLSRATGFNVVGHFIIALLPAAMGPARMQPDNTGQGILNGKEWREHEKMTGLVSRSFAKTGFAYIQRGNG
jgi:hypothetical protein